MEMVGNDPVDENPPCLGAAGVGEVPPPCATKLIKTHNWGLIEAPPIECVDKFGL